jgi:NADH-quinone oxidoreductase subunit E
MRVTSYQEGAAGDFAFTAENIQRSEKIIARYPEDRKASAVLPLLDIAQRQNGGWLSKDAIDYVANFLEIPPIRAYEVASFYSMFNLKPVGKFLVQVCRTTPCWLRGSDALTKACLDKLGVGMKEVSADGLFSVMEVECPPAATRPWCRSTTTITRT